MKRAYSLAIILALLATPAYALSVIDVQNEVAGYNCSGSTCTTTEPGTRTEKFVSGSSSPATGMAIIAGDSPTCKWGNGKPMRNVSPITCQPNSLVLSGGGPIYGTRTIDTLTTITKTISFDPEGEPGDEWSIETTTETVDVP